MTISPSQHILQDPKTSLYVSSKSTAVAPWILTSSVEEALSFKSAQSALSYCKTHNSLVSLNLLQVNLSVTELKPITRLDVVLKRNTHLDATHIGGIGNHYLYFHDVLTDDCYYWDNDEWELRHTKGVEGFRSITIHAENE